MSGFGGHATQHFSNFTDYLGGDKDILKAAFMKMPSCKLPNFFRAQKTIGVLKDDLAELALRLIGLVPSSAGVERVFSSMGFVHSDMRNRLGHDKVAKLAFFMRVLNDSVTPGIRI